MKYNYTIGIGATIGTALVVGIIAKSIVRSNESKNEANVQIAKAEAEKAKYEQQNKK